MPGMQMPGMQMPGMPGMMPGMAQPQMMGGMPGMPPARSAPAPAQPVEEKKAPTVPKCHLHKKNKAGCKFCTKYKEAEKVAEEEAKAAAAAKAAALANETSTRRQDKPGLDMLNAVLKDQILRNTFFKKLVANCEDQQTLVDELYANAEHAEPNGTGGDPSQFMCCVAWMLGVSPPTDDSLKMMMYHKDSPFIRCAAFLFLRLSRADDLWQMCEPFVHDGHLCPGAPRHGAVLWHDHATLADEHQAQVRDGARGHRRVAQASHSEQGSLGEVHGRDESRGSARGRLGGGRDHGGRRLHAERDPRDRPDGRRRGNVLPRQDRAPLAEARQAGARPLAVGRRRQKPVALAVPRPGQEGEGEGGGSQPVPHAGPARLDVLQRHAAVGPGGEVA